MSRLEFLSPAACAPESLASPLARALAGEADGAVRDLSLDAKIEVRGDVDAVEPRAEEELIRLSPRRGLLLVDEDPRERIESLREKGLRAYDATGLLAGLEVEGETLMRRLTDLDLNGLPAAGAFARIGAIVVRDQDERFRVYFPQELGHYVAEAVLDALEGLAIGQSSGPGPRGHGGGQTQGPVPAGQGAEAGNDPDGRFGASEGEPGPGRGSDPEGSAGVSAAGPDAGDVA